MSLYRILFALDALAVLALGYLFVDSADYGGLGETARIMGPIIAVPVAIMVGAHFLRRAGRTALATLLLALIALPALVFVFFAWVLLQAGAH